MTNASSADIRRHLTQKCAHLGIPVSGTFELTPRCNLSCKMCYVRLTPEQMKPIGRELTDTEWLNIAKDAKDAGMTFLLITGGEPTLRQDFPHIYRSLAQMGFSIAINTNGTLISEEIRSLFEEFPPAQVNITLYGTSTDDYKELCGNPSAFDAVTDALDWLQSKGILVHLNATIDAFSYPRWQTLEDFAKNRNLELRVQSYCFPPTRRSACDGCSEFVRLPAEDAGRLVVDEILYREGIDAVKMRAHNISSPMQKSCDLDIGEPMQCLAGKSQFWVTWDGKITPCAMLSRPKFNLTKQSFSSAWEELKAQVGQIHLCPECSNCETQSSCMNCAAVTFAETGDFSGKPEYMCKLNEAYRKRITELTEQDKKTVDA